MARRNLEKTLVAKFLEALNTTAGAPSSVDIIVTGNVKKEDDECIVSTKYMHAHQ